MSNIAAVPGTAQAQQKDIENMQKRKLWKRNNLEVRPVGNGRKERTLGKPVIPNRGRFAAGLAVASRPLLIASCLSHLGMTRKEQNQETALIPNIGVVFTVGGPLVYEEGGQSVSMSEGALATLVVDRDYAAE